MPVPTLVQAGLLPVGIHDATLSEIETAFGHQNDTRVELFSNSRRFCDELPVFGPLIKGIYVDGSFITSKAVPRDVDLVVVHDIDDFDELDAHPQAEYLHEDRALGSTSSTCSWSATKTPWSASSRRSQRSMRWSTGLLPTTRRASSE